MILVTGATGHIGNVLIRKLMEQGQKVRALDWRDEDTTPIKDLDIEQVEGDVLDTGSLDMAMRDVDPSFIWQGSFPSCLVRIRLFGKLMLMGRATWSRLPAVPAFAGWYTPAPSMPSHMLRMGLRWTNRWDSTRTTLTVNMTVPRLRPALWSRQAVADGLDAVIVCPTGVIGPYDFRGSELGEVIRSASEARTMFFVEGAYDFVDVRDVADGMIAAQAHGRRGESYILGGNKISVRYMLETVREVTGKAFASIKIPFSLAEFAAKFTPWYYQQHQVETALYSLLVGSAAEQLEHQPRQGCS